jgi:hypothetical protein
VWKTITDHRALLHSVGQLTERRDRQQRRWLTTLLGKTILNEALRGRVGECGPGANYAWQGSAPGLVERGAQPHLGPPLRE